jgi:protein TonB
LDGSRRLRSSISFSIVLHALIFLAWAALLGQRASTLPRRETILIDLDPAHALERARQQARASHEKRIVQTTAGQKTDQAAPNAFLGERTQTVDRQTVSKNKQIAQAQAARRPRPAARAPRVEKVEPNRALARFGLPILPKPDAKPRGPEIDRQDWTPSPGVMPSDYVKGFAESERTALNTREYVFFGYFQRIRQRLDRAWTGQLRDQLGKFYRAGRQLASDMEHTTRLLVTLNGRGDIVRVQIVEESGTRDLDDAAIRAFNQAGPFPNPPKGIVDARGLIELRWDFILRS